MYFAIGTPRVLSERYLELSGKFIPSQNLSFLDSEPNQSSPPSSAVSPSTATFPNLPRSSLICIRKCPAGPFFVTLASNTVALWSERPPALLSKVTRSAETVKEDGENIDVIWKHDGSQLLILTSGGFLHYFDVYASDNRMFEFQFSKTHHYGWGPGEAKGIPSKSLRFKMALEIDAGTLCGLELRDEIIVGTNNPPSLLSLNWSGEVNLPLTLQASDLPFYVDEKDPIAFMTSTPTQSLFGFVSLDGKAYLCQRHCISSKYKDDTPSAPHGWSGICFYNADNEDSPATRMAFNPTFTLVAIGNLQGVVHVYELHRDLSSTYLSHTLAITKPGNTTEPIRLGAVTTLQWTDDGHALAVGWIYGGISVWSAFGSLLMSTICEDTFAHASDGVVMDSSELFLSGVQDCFWGAGNFELFILPSSSHEHLFVQDMYVLSFAKSSIIRCNTWHNSRHVSLICDDRLLLYQGMRSDSTNTTLDPASWETIPLPLMYLRDNWPIQYVSMNATGRFVAIAGKRGLAHYNIVSTKWKIFGNEHQEQSFQVDGGLLWYRSLIIVACKNTIVPQGYQISIFSRETKLDFAYLLHREELPCAVLAMNMTESHLLLYCADHVVRYYSFHIQGHQVSLRPQQAFSMVELAQNVHSNSLIQGIARFPSEVRVNVDSMLRSPIVILSNGHLYMVLKKEESWEAMKITQAVEHFWISTQNDNVGEVTNSIWAFDGIGARIWTNIRVSDMEELNQTFSEPGLHLSLDFYPLTVLMRDGILVGIHQGLSLKNALEVPIFTTDTKTYLFVQFIIRHLLSIGLPQKAFNFSIAYQDLVYFDHVLEVLLHTVLEEELDSRPGPGNASLLDRVARFVEKFPNHLEIIVNCARKSEMSFWGYFFSIIGDPKVLFNNCVEQNSLVTATSYLIIIQTLEKSSLAVQLLEKTFENKDFETGSELVRFLKSIEQSRLLEAEELAQRDSIYQEEKAIAPLQESKNESEEFPDLNFVEVLVANHARKLLMGQEFRLLGRFAVLYGMNLSEWLPTERETTKSLLTNFAVTFQMLHEQFGWTFPMEFAHARKGHYPQQRSSSPLRKHGSIGDGLRSSTQIERQDRQEDSLDTQNQVSQNVSPHRSDKPAKILTALSNANGTSEGKSPSSVDMSSPTKRLGELNSGNPFATSHKKEEELRYLASCVLQGCFPELGSLLYSMLLDPSPLQECLEVLETEQLLAWKQALTATNARGYRMLVKAMQDALPAQRASLIRSSTMPHISI